MRILKLNHSHGSGKQESNKQASTPEPGQVSPELNSVAELLRQDQKLSSIGRLTASIVHEINNPLEAVVNLLYLMEREPDLSPKMLSLLKLAQQELGRVFEISRQTLNFSRETSRPVPVQMQDLLEEVLVLYQRRLQEKEIHLFRRYHAVESVTAFPGEMRQVFSNLIANAIEACPVGGSLWLRVQPAGRKGVRIIVADNGSGIDPALQKTLGMPFVTTKGQHGTGLGLWVTTSILARYGSELQIRSVSSAERHGTVISIFLPFEMQKPSALPNPPATSPGDVELTWKAAG